MKPGHTQPSYIAAYALTTDAGGDERKVRECAAFLMAVIPWIILMHIDCYQHQCHIIVSMVLLHADLWIVLLDAEVPVPKYFSCLSTLSNTLRESSAKLRDIWLELFPDLPGAAVFTQQVICT